MNGKLRAGVIGCGGMAQHHIAGYLASGRFELAAIADLDAAVMDEVDRELGVKPVHYTDAAAMLDRERLDVVSVCVWHTGHAPWTIAAAARRPRAILCEKPMAESLGRAEEMLVACRRNQVKLAIAHQRRFLPAYTLARELIARGAIGSVKLMLSFGGTGSRTTPRTWPTCSATSWATLHVSGSWATSSGRPTGTSARPGSRTAPWRCSSSPAGPGR